MVLELELLFDSWGLVRTYRTCFLTCASLMSTSFLPTPTHMGILPDCCKYFPLYTKVFWDVLSPPISLYHLKWSHKTSYSTVLSLQAEEQAAPSVTQLVATYRADKHVACRSKVARYISVCCHVVEFSTVFELKQHKVSIQRTKASTKQLEAMETVGPRNHIYPSTVTNCKLASLFC